MNYNGPTQEELLAFYNNLIEDNMTTGYSTDEVNLEDVL